MIYYRVYTPPNPRQITSLFPYFETYKALTNMNSNEVIRELKAAARQDKADFLPGFFQAYPGGYGEGDQFEAESLLEFVKKAGKA